MAEAKSVSARKATLLNPTEDDETVEVLLRRLFERVDRERAGEVVDVYRTLWYDHRGSLSTDATKPETVDEFRRGYPLHPDVLDTFTSKTATLADFQRVRGMLRILGRTIARLWATRPADTTAIHLHHIDPGYEPIRQEFMTRLGQAMYLPAVRNDIAGDGGKRALAPEIDDQHHRGMPPYATYAARTIFMHSLAFNESLKGVTPEHLRFAAIGPRIDISFVEAARQKFIANSAYLDDRPGAPMRFLTEANLTQVIRRQEANVDPGELRAQLNDRIKEIFSSKAPGASLEAVMFPGGPWDVPDEVGNGRPFLAVISYDACSVGAGAETVPELVARIYERKGSEGGSLGSLRNNLAFVVAEEGRLDDMRKQAASGSTQAALEEVLDDEEGDDLDSERAARLEQQALALEERADIESLLADIRALPPDTKVECLRQEIGKLRAGGYPQVMVFTQFTDTMDCLRTQLIRKSDLKIMCFSGRGGEVVSTDGTWRTISRDEVKCRFREGQADVLLCTDAAAEGLNFQFCGALINYDMPWNPMRVEQRIGRIDRLGQKHHDIQIVNLHYADTVETDVYLALRRRIGLFENVVGRLQPILARLPMLIQERVLHGQAKREDERQAAANEVEIEAARVQADGNGFDIDAVTETDLEEVVRLEPPLSLRDLDAVLASPILIPPGIEVSAMGEREYRYMRPGLGAPIRVTTNPAYYEQHAGTVELWSPGSPVFPEHEIPSNAAIEPLGENLRQLLRSIQAR